MENFNKSQVDVYQKVTDKILTLMSQGIIPWKKAWHGTLDGAISYTTGKPYSFLNQMLLGKAGEYLTFNQIQEHNGKIKKGAKAEMVVFFKMYRYEEIERDENGEEVKVAKCIPVLRNYNVFHISDVEGIESKIGEQPACTLSPVEQAESIIKGYDERENNLKISVRKSDKAYYSPALDEVVSPLLEQFDSESEYYATLFHELTHSTGAKSRCNRDEITNFTFFGSDPYAREELVAELGSAFLCAKSGIDCESTTKNSAAYIQSWSRKLKEDKRLIVSAASRAEKAVKYILGEE